MWTSEDDRRLASALAETARPLQAQDRDWASLLDVIGDARFVLLGTTTHGSHELFAERARLTRYLIEEGGFDALALDADWPEVYQLGRWVRGMDTPAHRRAHDALAGFQRFPAWLWRNVDMVHFVTWLREQAALGNGPSCWGLDFFGMYGAMEAMLRYLDQVDPRAAATARRRFAGLEGVAADEAATGEVGEAAAALAVPDDELLHRILERLRARDEGRRAHVLPDDVHFHESLQAQFAPQAMDYYRALLRGRRAAWNLHSRHLTEMLGGLALELDRRNGRRTRIVVWTHAAHAGDARGTELSSRAETSFGQLMRAQHPPGSVVLVGFTTYGGTLSAARSWGGPVERRRLQLAYPESYEALFHAGVRVPAFAMALRGEPALAGQRLERAVGAVYTPEMERMSHYVMADLARQFDGVVHVDRTTALEPLDRGAEWAATAAEGAEPAGPAPAA